MSEKAKVDHYYNEQDWALVARKRNDIKDSLTAIAMIPEPRYDLKKIINVLSVEVFGPYTSVNTSAVMECHQSYDMYRQV